MMKNKDKRSGPTYFESIPVLKVLNRRTRDDSDTETTSVAGNVTFEPASEKTEPYTR